MSQKWRDKANQDRKDQKVEKDRLVWIKKEVITSSVVERKLAPKWLGPYKVKEIIWDGSVYILENLWDSTHVCATDKVKPYYGDDTLIVEPEELTLPPKG